MDSSDFKGSKSCKQVLFEKEYEFGSNFKPSISSDSGMNNANSNNFSSVDSGTSKNKGVKKTKSVKWKNSGKPEIIDVESWKEINKEMSFDKEKYDDQNKCCSLF